MSAPLHPPIYEYEVCFRNGRNLFIMTDRGISVYDDLPKWIIASLMDANTSWENAKKVAIRTKDIMYFILHRVISPTEAME